MPPTSTPLEDKKLRVVIDTGVLISALIKRNSTPGKILEQIRSGQLVIIYSVPILLEIIDVLGRSSIRNKYQIRPEDISALVSLVRLRGELVDPQKTILVCRDEKDNKFLEAALEGNAVIIVSGDKDLLALHPFRGIHILSPAAFLENFV